MQKIQRKKNNFCSPQRVFYFVQSYGGAKHERWDGEAARGEKRFFSFNFKQGIYGFEKFRNASGFGVIKRTPGTRPSMQFKRTHTPRPIMQTDTQPSEVARNETAIF